MKEISPNYKRLYSDMIVIKYPDMMDICKPVLSKRKLSVLDVIYLNERIFGNSGKDEEVFNQRHRSYDKNTILTILEYQKRHKLNNVQLARYFKLSRNTVSKWKKMFYSVVYSHNS